jgi:hypothetical protein
VLAFAALQKPHKADATVNRQINFQGKIVLSSNSTNISNGTYNMEFKIYNGGDGVVGGGDETLLWTEDRLVGGTGGVTITDGIFQVNLGSVTSLPGSVDFNNNTIWLSMQIGNTSSCTITTNFQSNCSGDAEMSPMVRFTAAPYAFNADTLDGIDSAALGQLSANNTWTGTQTLQPTTNITSAIVKQTSTGSPTADIFNIQTANATNILQVTGPAANQAAVTLASVGAIRDLTLDSGSGTLKLGSNTTTLQKSGTAFTFDINNGSNSTLTITNAGAGTGSLSVEGNVTAGGSLFANTIDRSSAGQLSIGTGGASNATSIAVGSSSVTGITFTTDNNAANDIEFTGGATFHNDVVLEGHLALGNGAANSAAAALRLQETFDSNDNCGFGCYGVQTFPTITNPATPSRGVGLVSKVSTGAASFTLTEADGVLIQDPTVGSGSTITTNIGLRIDNQTAGTNDYAISLGGADTADILFDTDQTHVLKVQDQDTAATAGSALQVTGANGNTSGAGGDISITSGNGGGTGATNAGTITINNGTKSGAGTATINVGTSNTTALNLGNSSSNNTITGNSSSSFVLNGTTVSAAEFNVLDNGIEAGDLVSQGTPTDEFCLTYESGGGALLEWQSCGGGGGDNITVNGSAATDANFLNTTASGTSTGVTFALSTAPNPDTISITIGNASTLVAGAVTTGTQSFAGNKTFTGAQTLVHGASDDDHAFQVQDTFTNDVFHVDTNNGYFGSGDCTGSPVTSASSNFACMQGFNLGGQLYLGSGADAWVSLVQTSSNNNAVLSSKYGTTITTASGTQEALTVSNGTSSGDILVLQANTTPVATFSSNALTLGANYNLTTTSGTGTITLNSTFSNASGNAILITPSFTGGATNGLTYNGLSIASFSPTNASGTDTVNGISTGNLTDPGASITSTAFRAGTGWDTLFGGTTAGTNLFGFTNFTVTSAGVLTAVGINSGSGQIQGSGGINVTGNTSLASTAGNTVGLGNSTGAVTVTGSSGSTFVINGTTVDATEFNRLNGTSAALVDQDDFISGDGAGATASGSGLEAGTGGIGLVQGCSDNQVLKWNDTSSQWGCSADDTSGTSKFVVKGTNENVASGTTLQDDNELSFPVSASETWVFDFTLRVTNVNSATPDWKSAIKGASGWTCSWTLSGTEPAGAAFPQANGSDCDNAPTALANSTIVADANVPYQVNMRGVIRPTSSGNVVLQWAANTSGSLTVMAGSYVEAQKVGGSDLAEIYYTNDETVGPGDVVSMDSDLSAGVKKATGPYSNTLVGVISTKPGLLLGDETSTFQGRAVKLALSGRVPVKVSTENGAIEPGDLLTSSSTPGVAMKATKAGTVIGQALTSYNGQTVGELQMFIKNTTSTGSNEHASQATGEEILGALMSGNATTASPSNLSEVNTDRVTAGLEIVTPKLTADTILTNTIRSVEGKDIAIDIDAGGKLLLRGSGGTQVVSFDNGGNLTLSGALSVAGALNVEGQATFNGTTIFDKLVTFSDTASFKGNTYFSNNSGGYAVIRQGKKEVDVTFQNPYKDGDALPVIMVNVKDGQFVSYAYKDVTKNGFKIVLAQPAAQDTEFAWTGTNITDPKTADSAP